MKRIFLILCSLAFVVAAFGAVYKWVDEKGRVHYTDSPPEESKKQEVEIERGPTAEEAEKAQQRLERIQQELRSRAQERTREAERSALKKLGAIPPNVSSEYLSTSGSGISYHWNGAMVARYSIDVYVKKPLAEKTAYLEAQFPNPENLKTPVIVGRHWGTTQKEVSFISPPVKGLKCKNYEVIIKICHWRGCEQREHDDEPTLISIHRQLIKSSVDMDSVKSQDEMLEALSKKGGYCP